MHQLELAAVLSRDGLYILADSRVPNATIPVVVMGGQLYSLRIQEELSVAKDKWTDTAYFAGGPYTAELCAEMTRQAESDEYRMELLESELAFWKSMVTKMEPAMALLRDMLMSAGRQDVAMQTQDILNELVPIAQAQEVADEIQGGKPA